MRDLTSVGIVTSQKVKFDNPLHLKSGATLNSYELVYETYGKLNKERDNAVLVCHALSGNHHLAGKYSSKDKYDGYRRKAKEQELKEKGLL